MELKDFLFTPVTLLIVYVAAYSFRDRFTNKSTRRYFIPALTVKVIGAISLGLIYQFYYQGGDTFNYFEQSKVLYGALMNDPLDGIRLLLANGDFHPGTFEYSQLMYWYESPSEYLIIKLAAFLGLFSFGTYTSIAVLFAVISFSGLWAAYITFLRQYPLHSGPLALALFFLPSVFFWGSGLMKDTLALASLGWLFYAFHNVFVRKEDLIISIAILLITIYVLSIIRVFVLLSFLPPAIIWIFLQNNKQIKSIMIRKMAAPLMLLTGLAAAYYIGMNITEGDIKYDIDEIGRRTKINAEYLYRISLQEGGSAYYLGELDGSIWSMIKLAPQAMVVTFFRPYLWEIKNIMMLLSAVEALLFLVITLRLLFIPGLFRCTNMILNQPMLLFCLFYSLILGVAVGLNSYNFGSLVRYKIQILPFFLSMCAILWYHDRGLSKISR